MTNDGASRTGGGWELWELWEGGGGVGGARCPRTPEGGQAGKVIVICFSENKKRKD